MLLKDLKSMAKFLAAKRRYRGARISYGASVRGDSRLGARVVVEPDCYIVDSMIGDDVQIHEGARLFRVKLEGRNTIHSNCQLGEANVGSYSYIGESSIAGAVNLGRFCSVGAYFICGYGDHPVDFVSTSPVFYSTRKQCVVTFADREYFEERKEVNIGHDVWIGARVFVRDGVRIGHGAIVAAGSVVVKDVPDYTIVGGVPAKAIRLRFKEEVVKKLLQIEWWNWSEADLREAQPFFVREDVESFLEWNKF